MQGWNLDKSMFLDKSPKPSSIFGVSIHPQAESFFFSQNEMKIYITWNQDAKAYPFIGKFFFFFLSVWNKTTEAKKLISKECSSYSIC